jgi:hypothetical protein
LKLLDVDVWRKLRRAVKTCDLNDLQTRRSMSSGDADVIDDERLAAAARCIGAFFAEAKHNKSIVAADLNLTMGATIGDLSDFILNNNALKDLTLSSSEIPVFVLS